MSFKLHKRPKRPRLSSGQKMPMHRDRSSWGFKNWFSLGSTRFTTGSRHESALAYGNDENGMDIDDEERGASLTTSDHEKKPTRISRQDPPVQTFHAGPPLESGGHPQNFSRPTMKKPRAPPPAFKSRIPRRFNDVSSAIRNEQSQGYEAMLQDNRSLVEQFRKEIVDLRKENESLKSSWTRRGEELSSQTRELNEYKALTESLMSLKATQEETLKSRETECQTLRDENKRKTRLIEQWENHNKRTTSALTAKNKSLQISVDRYTRKLQEYTDEFNNHLYALKKQNEELGKQNEQLHVVHVKSLAGIGSGLEPISEQIFREKLRTLQSDMNQWCRKNFKRRSRPPQAHLRQCEPFDLAEIDWPSYDSLSVSNIAEILIWKYFDAHIITAWFPGYDAGSLEHLKILEADIRSGDHSSTGGKFEHWRSFTVSMLFQNPKRIRHATDPTEHTGNLKDLLHDYLGDPPLPDSAFRGLQAIISDVLQFVAELKCQCEVYEIDTNVAVGNAFDQEMMDDVKKDYDLDNESGVPVVACILSHGLVRKQHANSPEVYGRVAKARVLLRIMEKSGYGEKEFESNGTMERREESQNVQDGDAAQIDEQGYDTLPDAGANVD